jgi:WD40 repeat protein
MVWDLGSGLCLRTIHGHTGGIDAVAVVAGGWIMSAATDGTLRVWDLKSGACLALFPWDYPFTSVAVTTRPPYTVVAGDSQGNVLLFRIENLDRA